MLALEFHGPATMGKIFIPRNVIVFTFPAGYPHRSLLYPFVLLSVHVIPNRIDSTDVTGLVRILEPGTKWGMVMFMKIFL